MALLKKFTVPATAALTIGALLMSSTPGQAAESLPTLMPVDTTSNNLLQSPEQAEALLKVIDKIPESVLLKGDFATQQWIALNLGYGGPNAVNPQGFLECSGAILWVIGSTVFPAAKILKIKRYMNALGGVGEAIRIMWGASFSYEKLQAFGGAAAALAAELTGISEVRNKCFN